MLSVLINHLAIAAVFAVLATAQNSSSTVPTANIFLNDDFYGELGYAISIVSACAEQTVYAIQCTSGPASIGSQLCGPNAETGTFTEGPSTFVANYKTTTVMYDHSFVIEGGESCALLGTTAADCTVVATATVDGTSTQTASTTHITGSAYHRYQVPITGGAEKTASATGKCTSVNSGAVPVNARQAVTLVGALAAGTFGMLVF